MLRNEQQMSVHLYNALGRLKRDMLTLASSAEEQVARSLQAFLEDNLDLAKETIARDGKLDRMEVELEEECLKVLALYQPVAHDLRFVVSVLKLTNDLERIADYGVHIAERAVALTGRNDVANVLDLGDMGQRSLQMLRKSIECLVNQDAKLARTVWQLDKEIDLFHKGNFEKLETHIKAQPNKAGVLLQLLSVSRYIERIADLATNIADDVVYIVEGKLLRHNRQASER